MKKLILILFISALLLRCGEDESVMPDNTDCGQKGVVDNSLFADAPNDEFDFVMVEIDGDCLSVTIRYGGGCGDIELKLIGSERVLFPNPGLRDIRLSLKDEDACEALISKEIIFDLTPFRLLSLNSIPLSLAGWNEPLLYKY